MVAGDVAMLEHEVTPVLKALRANGINVVAIHHHMTGITPAVIFLHYYGTGPAPKLAQGVRAAVDLLGKTPPSSMTVRDWTSTAALCTMLACSLNAASVAQDAPPPGCGSRPSPTVCVLGDWMHSNDSRPAIAAFTQSHQSLLKFRYGLRD